MSELVKRLKEAAADERDMCLDPSCPMAELLEEAAAALSRADYVPEAMSPALRKVVEAAGEFMEDYRQGKSSRTRSRGKLFDAVRELEASNAE